MPRLLIGIGCADRGHRIHAAELVGFVSRCNQASQPFNLALTATRIDARDCNVAFRSAALNRIKFGSCACRSY